MSPGQLKRRYSVPDLETAQTVEPVVNKPRKWKGGVDAQKLGSLSRVAFGISAVLGLVWIANMGPLRMFNFRQGAVHRVAQHPTLVVYVFAFSDPEYQRNLLYFMDQGVREDDGCNYFIIFQTDGNDATAEAMQSFLAEFGHYKNIAHTTHENTCFDWGTYSWFLKRYPRMMKQYKYFIFMNSSVRGPYTPRYYTGHWSEIFTSKITDSLKMVGPTISCGGLAPEGYAPLETPHVQSYVLAMDYVGLTTLLKYSKAFECYESLTDTIYHSELGATKVLLDAGFNVASLMARYNGIDFRLPQNKHCGRMANPYASYNYDGMGLHPFEVVFVKIKKHETLIPFEGIAAALKYENWRSALPGDRDIWSNEFIDDMNVGVPRILALTANKETRKECFDTEYYKANNILPGDIPDDKLYKHFVQKGQFEDDKVRFVDKCSV